MADFQLEGSDIQKSSTSADSGTQAVQSGGLLAKTERTAQAMEERADETYLIFSIRTHRYALQSSKVQQIVHAQKVRQLPFVPDYIEGILNVHGNPYTAVNTLILDNEYDTDIPGLTFIVLKRDDDQFCIHVSNIELFFEPEEDDIFEDRIKYKKQFIMLFDSDRIEAALLKDLSEDDL